MKNVRGENLPRVEGPVNTEGHQKKGRGRGGQCEMIKGGQDLCGVFEKASIRGERKTERRKIPGGGPKKKANGTGGSRGGGGKKKHQGDWTRGILKRR